MFFGVVFALCAWSFHVRAARGDPADRLLGGDATDARYSDATCARIMEKEGVTSCAEMRERLCAAWYGERTAQKAACAKTMRVVHSNPSPVDAFDLLRARGGWGGLKAAFARVDAGPPNPGGPFWSNVSFASSVRARVRVRAIGR
jgi:hypothetical protein